MWVYYLGQKYTNIGGKIMPNFLQCNADYSQSLHCQLLTLKMCINQDKFKLLHNFSLVNQYNIFFITFCSPGSHIFKNNRLWLSAVLLTTRGY